MGALETQVMLMLKRGNYQPSEIAKITGVSLLWVELKAKQMGLVPLTVQKAVVRR